MHVTSRLGDEVMIDYKFPSLSDPSWIRYNYDDTLLRAEASLILSMLSTM